MADNRRPRPDDEPTPGFNVSAPTAVETPSLGSSLAAMMPNMPSTLTARSGAAAHPVDA
jgi:hypothetical protein